MAAQRKERFAVQDAEDAMTGSQEVGKDGELGVNGGTGRDDADMYRLGRRQELKRNFHALAVLGLTSTVLITWNGILVSLSFAYLNGGRAGAIYVFIGSWIAELLVAASLAEMASMAPTSAGQFHWVSEFAPPSLQKPFSYFAGWLAALTWQSYIAMTAYQAAEIALNLASLNNPNYAPTGWQGTLATILVCVIIFLFNVYGAKHLPLIEGVILFFLIIGFFAVLIPIWILSPMVPKSEAFGSFSNFGGWASVGAACVIGQLSPVGSMTGVDAAAHMSEEVKDASRNVPRMMMGTIFLSGITGFAVTITLSFCIQDVETQVYDSTSVYPFIDIFAVAVGSNAGAIGMTAAMVLLAVFSSINSMAAASRQAWAFARDNGLPFRNWFTQLTLVNSTPLPVNAMLASLGVSLAIALLNIGGSEVFDSIYGLGSSAASVTYILCIGSLIWRRLFGAPLPPRRWSLGRFGLIINCLSLAFLVQFVVIAFFPLFRQVDAQTMNWGIAMFGGVAVISISYYIVHGRKVYNGPVFLVRQ